MPLGEFAAVRTRSSGLVSLIGFGSNIRTPASLGAVLRRENLKASWSNGLCRKRSEFGYSSRIFPTIEGPVSSNLLAPPTKHTAILDLSNSSFRFGGGWTEKVVELGGVVRVWWPRRKERKGAKEERGLVVVGEEERERKIRRESGGMSMKTRRQSR